MPATEPSAADRFKPHASREMAGMFDGVSRRYDLLNRLMTLDMDGAWRAAMARAIPPGATVVVDLCTGNGVSAHALEKSGRLLVALDVSLGMLEHAQEKYGDSPWSAWFGAADAFRLPLKDRCADAVTVAFGMRNLRPRAAALAEIGRILEPGGVLVVLEATAPHAGFTGALHGFWLRHVVPLLGRLSPDPTAYRYLSQSIFEFGDGRAFESDMEEAGFEPIGARRFMMGATTLWAGRWQGRHEAQQVEVGKDALDSPPAAPRKLHSATPEWAKRGDLPHTQDPRTGEWRLWTGMHFLLSVAIVVTLVMSSQRFIDFGGLASVEHWQRSSMRILLTVGIGFFSLRSLYLLLRFLGPPRRG